MQRLHLAGLLLVALACSTAVPRAPAVNVPASEQLAEQPGEMRETEPLSCVASRASPAFGLERHGVRSVVREVSGPATPGLREALLGAAMPQPLVSKIASAFSYDSDLPSQLPSDARFWVVYEARIARGRTAEVGVRCVVIDDGTKLHQLYGFDTRGGALALVHDDGRGIAWIDLEEPVRGARVTSPFGWRIHPVFGDRRFHRGIDLGAARGTPVVAAAAGVIATVGSRGNYGRLVVVHHDDHLETSYAHLSRFARGLRVGSRVKRGQRIGFVGSSGVATGPHLYFEVAVDRVQIDPLAVAAGFPIQLTARELERLRQSRSGGSS